MSMPQKEAGNSAGSAENNASYGTGLEQAAAVLIALGEDAASRVISHLPTGKIVPLTNNMNTSKTVNRGMLRHVLKRLMTSLEESPVLMPDSFVADILHQALGDERARGVLSGRSSPVQERLMWLEPESVASMIRDENPQLQAVVLASMEPEFSAIVIKMLAPSRQKEVALKLSQLKEIPAASLDTISELLDRHDMGVAGGQSVNGIGRMAEMLNYLDAEVSSSLLQRIEEFDSDLAESIVSQRLNIDHLLQLNPQHLRVIIESMETDVLAMALKGLPTMRLEAVFECMSRRAASFLRDEMQSLGTVRISQVRKARDEMIAVARNLEEEELIELSLGNEATVS
ncbi:flagellar motor switch protein FliG [Spongorhabdus nitratireducens]